MSLDVGFDLLQFGESLLHVAQLRFQRRSPGARQLQQETHLVILGGLAGIDVIKIKKLLDLGDGKTQTLAAADQRNTPVGRAWNKA